MRVSIGFFLALCFALPPWRVAAQEVFPIGVSSITSAAAVLELAPAMAARRIPVTFRGVVTCSDAVTSLLFVQDKSSGVYVYSTSAFPPVGTEVEVKGATDKGLFSPIVAAESIRTLGPSALPLPAVASIEQISTGRLDSQWVEVEGTVLRQHEQGNHVVLTLASGSSRLDVRILQPGPSRTNLLDARVKIKGVSGTHYNDRRQLTGFHLLTQFPSFVTVVQKPKSDPFAAELRLSKDIFYFTRNVAAEHRVRLRGVVTFYWPGRDFYLQDEAGGVRVQSRQTASLKPGDVVEVVGFPDLTSMRPSLIESSFRKVGEGKDPVPRIITPKEALAGEAEGEVVAIEGMLVLPNEAHSGYGAAVLESNGQKFRACYRLDWSQIPQDDLTGARVRVTGVCALDPSTDPANPSFSIWMRRVGDFEVLTRPSIWSQRQTKYALGGFGIAVALAAGWVGLVRVRVQRQTAAIRSREKALEERYLDLFENSNDIIYSHDLEGRVTSMNGTGQALLGYTLEELSNMNASSLIDPADLEMARAKTQAKLDGTDKRTAYELRLRSKNGQRLFIEVNSRLLYADGIPIGVQGIARDITARKKAEEALRLSERQLRASLEERERLGRDLHDGIIQSIYAAGLNLDDCARIVANDPESVEKRLRKINGDLNRVIRDVRDFIVGLDRHRLKGYEFKSALKSLVLTIGEANSSRIELDIDGAAAAELDAEQATQLLHIAQEALSNSVRHANAQKVAFRLHSLESGLRFEVSDDGVGFNPAACEGKGFGLRNIAARAKDIKAAFQLVSQHGEGTRIVLDIGAQSSEQSPRENPVAHR